MFLTEIIFLLDGKIKGKTMLQKIFFILRSKFPDSPELKDLHYILHYYGPYSRDLAQQLDRLTLAGEIALIPEPVGDVMRYNIALTKAGQSKAESDFCARSPEEQALLKRMAGIAKRLNKKKLDEVISSSYKLAAKQGLGPAGVVLTA